MAKTKGQFEKSLLITGPPAIQNAVRILPTIWAMEGMLDLGLRGGGLPEILPEAGVLLGFAAIFFSVGVVRFRFE